MKNVFSFFSQSQIMTVKISFLKKHLIINNENILESIQERNTYLLSLRIFV